MKTSNDKLKTAQLLAINNGFDIASYCIEWQNLSVYIADFKEDGDIIHTGLPIFILVNNDNIARLADNSETDILMDLVL